MTENEVVAWLSRVPKEKVSKLAQEAAEIRERNNCKLGLVFCCPVMYSEGANHRYWIVTHKIDGILYGVQYSLYPGGSIDVERNSRLSNEAFEVDTGALHKALEDHFDYMKRSVNALKEATYS